MDNKENRLDFWQIKDVLEGFLLSSNSFLKTLLISKEFHKKKNEGFVDDQLYFYILIEHGGLPIDLKFYRTLRDCFPTFVGHNLDISEISLEYKEKIENYIKNESEIIFYNNEDHSKNINLVITKKRYTVSKKKEANSYNELLLRLHQGLLRLEIFDLMPVRSEVNHLIKLKKQEISTAGLFTIDKDLFLKELLFLNQLDQQVSNLMGSVCSIASLKNDLIGLNHKILEKKKEVLKIKKSKRLEKKLDSKKE